MDLKSLTAVELGKKIQAKEVTVKEAVEACFTQIDKVEKEVNSFVSLQKEAALKRAEEVQKLIDDGTLTGPLPAAYQLLLRYLIHFHAPDNGGSQQLLPIRCSCSAFR